jgi:isopentenyl-diphosphate Delta-isomerase
MAAKIAVVDDNNRFVRWEERTLVHQHQWPHRSVHVFLFDSRQRLVLQQRHRNKQTYPLFWDLSASGHVDDCDYVSGPDERLDDVYQKVAERELQEELGVTTQLKFLGYFPPLTGVHYEHFHFFQGCDDGPYRIQVEEVEDLRSVTREELVSMRKSQQNLTHTLTFLADWLIDRGLWLAAERQGTVPCVCLFTMPTLNCIQTLFLKPPKSWRLWSRHCPCIKKN